jgi:hypothetical protein
LNTSVSTVSELAVASEKPDEPATGLVNHAQSQVRYEDGEPVPARLSEDPSETIHTGSSANNRKIITQDPHDVHGMKRIATNTSGSHTVWVKVAVGRDDLGAIEIDPATNVGRLTKAIIGEVKTYYDVDIHTVKVFPPASDDLTAKQYSQDC